MGLGRGLARLWTAFWAVHYADDRPRLDGFGYLHGGIDGLLDEVVDIRVI